MEYMYMSFPNAIISVRYTGVEVHYIIYARILCVYSRSIAI